MKDIISFHNDFPALYQCILLDELPSNYQNILYFNPSCTRKNTKDGLLATIKPQNNDSWTGVFEWGEPCPDSVVSGFWSLPHEGDICVISRGIAYIIPVIEAENYSVVQLRPICHVIPISALGIIVFGNFTSLCAFNDHGLLWQTSRLSWDGIKILGIKDTYMIGTGWDAPNQKNIPFSVNLTTGAHEGGASPPCMGQIR